MQKTAVLVLVRRAGCCLAFVLRGLRLAETPRHSSTCPSLPKAGGQQPSWPWVPLTVQYCSLYRRLQTPLVAWPAGRLAGTVPGIPYEASSRWPPAWTGPLWSAVRTSAHSSPEYVAASASLCLVGLSPSLRHLATTQFPDLATGLSYLL